MKSNRRHLVWHQGALVNPNHPTAVRLRSQQPKQTPSSSPRRTTQQEKGK